MFARNKVTGVHNGQIRTDHTQPSMANSAYASRKAPNIVTAASLGSGFGGLQNASNSVSINSYFNSQYIYMFTGILPADPSFTDMSALALFYRDIYLFDNVAGSAVDIQSTFPFSDFELRGLDEKELDIYRHALEQLNISQMLPEISKAYLVDGFFAGTLVFDAKSKQFMDTLVHDALQCTVIPSPLFNAQPEIHVRVGSATQQYLNSNSKYAHQRLATLPPSLIAMLNQGAFELNPISTLYLGRRALTDRAYVSFLHRILPMYLIEKTLFRGTLVEAARRQRATTHLTAGDDLWTPTGEELNALVQLFQTAEFDPLGGWVSTRNAVQATDIRPGGDFWKWTDMADILTPYKLRALGISESFLSGDASFASAESAVSTFLQTTDTYRNELTNAIFYSTLFPLIAISNGLYKDNSNKVKGNRVSEYLASAVNRANLKIPQIIWHKSLEGKDEDNKFEMLEKASEKGVPVPLKTWMAAAGVDPETLEKDLKADKEYRKQLSKYTGKDTSHEGEDEPGDSFDPEQAMETAANQFTTQSFKAGYTSRRPLLSRDFGGETDAYTFTKTGKKKHVYNQSKHRKDMNQTIAKIAARAEIDPEYAAELVKRNKRAGLPTSIPGAGDLKRGRN